MMPPYWQGGFARASAVLLSAGRDVRAGRTLLFAGQRSQQLLKQHAGHCIIATRDCRCYSYFQASRRRRMVRTRRKYQQVQPPPPPPPPPGRSNNNRHSSPPPSPGDFDTERSQSSGDFQVICRAFWQVGLTFLAPTYGAVLFTSFVVSTNADRRLKIKLAVRMTELATQRAQEEVELAELDRELVELRAGKGDQLATIQEPSGRTKVDLKWVEHDTKMAELERETAELNRKTAELKVQLGDDELIRIGKLKHAEMVKRYSDVGSRMSDAPSSS